MCASILKSSKNIFHKDERPSYAFVLNYIAHLHQTKTRLVQTGTSTAPEDEDFDSSESSDEENDQVEAKNTFYFEEEGTKT